ncbi:DUF2628 domain-containing protein [Aquamicrobium segne]|uniref:DUF2628 domain-containing protein n=1 Tax=Aquamicrobium segne TaxID=469547 RepID=A0ABW0H1G2_9HYPH
MASHVVMLPPLANPTDRAERAVLVRDGFAWVAFFLPLLWLLWHRLWGEAFVAVLLFCGFLLLGPVGSLLAFLVGLYVGLEGQAMRIAALRRRGYRQWGVVEGANLDDAHMRYAYAAFDEWLEPEPEPVIGMAPVETARQHVMEPAPSLGLVSYGRS